jgi:plastocyanin
MHRSWPLLAAGALLAAGVVPALADTVTVTIDKLAFSPKEISVKAGDTVEWVNKDAFAHTATVKDGWEVMIPPKKTASRVMTAGDTVDYFCRFHPNMKGKIAVTP